MKLTCSVAIAIALVLAQVALAPYQASAAPRAVISSQVQADQACENQPVVDTIKWTDGAVFTLRECARGLFKIIASKMKVMDWAIEQTTAREGERVELMGHWTIPTYKCSRDGRPTMSCA